jgi:hypothetical protein
MKILLLLLRQFKNAKKDKLKITLTLLILLSSILAFAQNKNVVRPVIAITHVNVIDATGSPIQSDMTVIISGNKIVALAKAGKISIPQEAEIINSKGKYLIPGLWDMHFHAFQSVFKNDYRFTLCIANGVTGIREMWTHMNEMSQVNLWRKQFYQQPGTIPRFGSVGTMVDGVPPVREGSDTATTAESARLLVRKIKASGSDFVKVYNNLSRTAYFALADECKKQNIPFAGHLPDFILLREAADAGQQSIEHITGLYQRFYHDCPPVELLKRCLPRSQQGHHLCL